MVRIMSWDRHVTGGDVSSIVPARKRSIYAIEREPFKGRKKKWNFLLIGLSNSLTRKTLSPRAMENFTPNSSAMARSRWRSTLPREQTCNSPTPATSFILWPRAAARSLSRASACSLALATRFLPPLARSIVLNISLRTCWFGWPSMALKAENVRSFVTMVFMALLSATLAPAQAAPPKQPSPPSTFDAQTASRLLRELSEALQGQSEKKFLRS